MGEMTRLGVWSSPGINGGAGGSLGGLVCWFWFWWLV